MLLRYACPNLGVIIVMYISHVNLFYGIYGNVSWQLGVVIDVAKLIFQGISRDFVLSIAVTQRLWIYILFIVKQRLVYTT